MKQWITLKGTSIYQVTGGRSNAFLISGPSNCTKKYFLVDTGIGWAWNRLVNNLNHFNLSSGSLSLILTHTHFDHAANAAKIKEKYQTKVIVHQNEADYLQSGKNTEVYGTILFTRVLVGLFGRFVLPRVKYAPASCDIQVDEKYLIHESGYQIYTLHTPGHSTGSMSVIVDDEIAIVGDAMFGVFPGSVFPPYAANPKMMVDSWKKLLDTGCVWFLPGHGTVRSRELLKKQYDRYRLMV